MTPNQTGRDIRLLCRRGEHTGPTAGLAPGYTQANVVILSRDFAPYFEEFCRLNPKPCPLLAIIPPGQTTPISLASDADIRTDLPRYRIFRDGVCVDRPIHIENYWREDLVTFLLGCSFTFEWALLNAGLPVRHIEQSCNVPMYKTNVICKPAGPFHGPLVVSMRPMTPAQAELAIEVTNQIPQAHGAPVHIGNPSTLGIPDLTEPDYGDSVTIAPQEVPVFWACGVTPMAALAESHLPFFMTHEPGHMLLTDLLEK